jgi:prepilin-type N-terminal cleavage/methylation domain-containing protein
MTENKSQAAARGFTLIETMIAIAILSFGVVSLLAVFGMAVSVTQNAQENLIARQKALQTMESVYTARNSQQITFAQIANIASGGIFTNAATPLWAAGPDGLVNTADDIPFAAAAPCPAGPECLVLPGKDGILGTADDVGMSLSNFTRQIQIASVLEDDGVTINPNLRQITVTITYYTGSSHIPQTYTVTGLISAFH